VSEKADILSMRQIRMAFHGIIALDKVNFSVREGEIHALVGENGAGKSTLMKILGGIFTSSSYYGAIAIKSRMETFESIKDSENAGIAVIYQEPFLVKDMNVCENLFLGNEILNKNGLIDWDTAYTRSKEILNKIGLSINPATKIKDLGIGTQHFIEIAKAVTKKTSILVLDELTAVLTEDEIEHLMGLLRTFREQGMTIIFISHRLNEVFQIADQITVLCDGKNKGTFTKEELTEDKLISLMVGRELTQRFPPSNRKAEDIAGKKVALEIRNWTVYDPKQLDKIALNNINLNVRKGEILGIAGIKGAGRTELMLSIMGIWGRKSSGELLLFGKSIVIRSPGELIKAGISYLPEDQQGSSLAINQNIKENIALSTLYSRLKTWFIDQDAELAEVKRTIEFLQIKVPSVEQDVQYLSAGDRKKIALGKLLLTKPDVIIFDEPTQGIAVGAKYEAYTIMQNLAESGMAIIMISSELPEILGMSDRILVIREGVIVKEMLKGEATQEKIISYATGGNIE
jgi:ABC-type sugar transport system ATPase subunit